MDEEEFSLDEIEHQIIEWEDRQADGVPIASKQLAKWKQRKVDYFAKRQPPKIISTPLQKEKPFEQVLGKWVSFRAEPEIEKLYDQYYQFQKTLTDWQRSKKMDRSKTFRQAIREWLQNKIETEVKPYNERLKRAIEGGKLE